jgi:hypothetical protein
MNSLDTLFTAECLGKLTSPRSLRKVLSNATLRWSSPAAFNDPYDCQLKPKIPAYSNEIGLLAIQEVERILDGTITDFSPESTKLAPMYAGLRQQHLLGNVDLDGLTLVLIESLKRLCNPNTGELSSSLYNDIAPKFLSLRILCLTKAFGNILMWSHYADDHKGALLVFKPCTTDGDFNEAAEVSYLDSMPTLLSSHEMVKMATGQITIADHPIMDRYINMMTVSKGSDWVYEREWRIRRGLDDAAQPAHAYWDFDPAELHAVVFGCRFNNRSMRLTINHYRDRYPTTRWLKAVQVKDRFELGVTEV